MESQKDRIKHKPELEKMLMESYSHHIAQYIWAGIALAGKVSAQVSSAL